MKLALRWIPTEVWVDIFIFPWISRKQLGKIVHRFRNRYFAEILQYCLHERGKQTLGHLQLKKSGIIKSLEWEPYREKLNFALTPMPENVKFFKQFTIMHFDAQTLAFLRRINTLFLLNDVNLFFNGFRSDRGLANLRPILEQLAPLLHGIHSLAFDFCAIPLVEQHFGQKLAAVKMLAIDLATVPSDQAVVQAGINFCMNWLTFANRDPNEPRFLRLYTNSEIFQQFSNAIQQQFQSAKSPCTFAIQAKLWDKAANNIAHFHFENDLDEQLDGYFNAYGTFLLYRHQPNAGTTLQELQEWVGQTVEESDRSSGIKIPCHVTIGQIDGVAGANEGNNNNNVVVEEEVEDPDQPSTSKKPKLA